MNTKKQEVIWHCQSFESLSPFRLYDFLRLRSDVFVVEQKCVFLDLDDNDQYCLHVMGYLNNALAAYSRLVPPGTIYEEASIGRVVTLKNERRTGIGKILMNESIQILYLKWSIQPIKIGAQLYLKSFYESYGFEQVSEVLIEDGIPHIYMIRSVGSYIP